MNETNILNKNIAELRKSSNMTQEQLAKRLGISFQAVSKWENSQSCPDVMLLPRLAEIFGVSIDSLFGLEKVEEAIIPAVEYQSELPWPDDEGIYMVVYQGHSLISEEPAELNPRLRELPFVWEGPALNVSSVLSVRVEGDVAGDVSAGGNLSCDNVGGSAAAGGSITCDDIYGSAEAGGSITCDGIRGNASAGMNITADEIRGNVSAGGHVSCDGVEDVYDGDGNFRGIRGSFHLERDDMSPEQREKYENIKRNAENIADSALGAADKALSAVEKTLKGIFKK